MIKTVKSFLFLLLVLSLFIILKHFNKTENDTVTQINRTENDTVTQTSNIYFNFLIFKNTITHVLGLEADYFYPELLGKKCNKIYIESTRIILVDDELILCLSSDKCDTLSLKDSIYIWHDSVYQRY